MSSYPVSLRGRDRSSGLGVLALVFVTASWGSTFFLIKDLLDRVPVVDFLALRFAIASVALFLVAPRALRRLSPAARRRGVALGLLYGVAQILQTHGLEHTSASVSGFVTGMYVVCTPLLAAFFLRQRIGPVTWAAVGLATAGLAVLSLRGFAIGYGEAVTFASAVLYAAHIVGLGAWATPRDAFGLSVLQMFVITGVCGAAAVPGGVVLPDNGADWWSVLYMALVAGALALVAQTWAQAHLAPTRAAIIMTMEPVFAAFFAVLLGGESLTVRMLVGGALVLIAMYTVELVPRRHVEGEVQHLTV
ncbi:MAG TPA: DMT family transporter [Nocardioidaceae bacterium]|nr:DMT family transporter [Nocardioidaceae bacterium]